MTTFKPGNYITFLQIGKNTFRDNLKFITNAADDKTVRIERIRRRNDTLFKKFCKYERNYLSLDYIDQENKQIGGKLKVHTIEFNLSQLAAYNYNQYGYFTDDKFVFAKFDSDIDFSNDESSKFNEITRSTINSTDIIVRHNFELVDGLLQYRLEINPNLIERYHEDLSTPNEDNVIGSELVPKYATTFTEQLLHKLI